MTWSKHTRYWQTRNVWIPVIFSSMLILVTAWSCTSHVSDSKFVRTSLVNVSSTYGTSYLNMSWTHRPSTRSRTGWMIIGHLKHCFTAHHSTSTSTGSLQDSIFSRDITAHVYAARGREWHKMSIFLGAVVRLPAAGERQSVAAQLNVVTLGDVDQWHA